MIPERLLGTGACALGRAAPRDEAVPQVDLVGVGVRVRVQQLEVAGAVGRAFALLVDDGEWVATTNQYRAERHEYLVNESGFE